MARRECFDQLHRLRGEAGMTDAVAAPRAVLFDLDGTLVDSSADLIRALGMLCRELAAPLPDPDAVRPRISAGSRAMLRSALPGFDAQQIDALVPRFLEVYAAGVAIETRPFPGMSLLLDKLDARGIPWGVVTNKPTALGEALMDRLGLAARCVALVCGDTLPVRKPDPEPVRHACRLAGVESPAAWFVGDDLRDIQAGRGAGTRTIAAAWGYLDGGDPAAWGADWIAPSVEALHAAIDAA
jgi:phosphoglycolate phosphatase